MEGFKSGFSGDDVVALLKKVRDLSPEDIVAAKDEALADLIEAKAEAERAIQALGVVDPTLSVAGAPADAAAVGAVNGQLSESIVEISGGSGKAFFIKDFEIDKENKYLEYGTCSEKSYNGYFISKSYFVPKGFVLSYKVGTQNTVIVAETNETQTFYRKIAEYQRLGYSDGTYVANKDLYVCFCGLKTYTDTHAFCYKSADTDINKATLNLDALGNNIEILYDNAYVNNSNNIRESYNGFAISKSYFVKKGCIVRYKVEVYGCGAIMETDESQTYYRVLKGTDTTRKLFDDFYYAPKDMYVCFGWYKEYNHNSFAISNTADLDYNNVTPNMQNDGLNILVFGDSITDCTYIGITDGKTTSYTFPSPSISYVDENGKTHNYDKWAYLMQNYLPIKEVRCYAKSGACYRDRMQSEPEWEARQQLSEQITLAFNDINNPNGVFNQNKFEPNYVIFALGINDRWDSMTDGDYDATIAKNVYNADNSLNVEATLNTLDRTNFSDAIRWAFLKTKAKFPYAQFLCVLPLQTGDVENPMWLAVRSRIKRMAERHSIKVIDGGYEMGICSDFDKGGKVGLYLKDGLHPNEYGQNLYTKFIVNAIKSTYVKDDFMNK